MTRLLLLWFILVMLLGLLTIVQWLFIRLLWYIRTAKCIVIRWDWLRRVWLFFNIFFWTIFLLKGHLAFIIWIYYIWYAYLRITIILIILYYRLLIMYNLCIYILRGLVLSTIFFLLFPYIIIRIALIFGICILNR